LSMVINNLELFNHIFSAIFGSAPCWTNHFCSIMWKTFFCMVILQQKTILFMSPYYQEKCWVDFEWCTLMFNDWTLAMDGWMGAFVIGHGVNQIPRILTAPWDLYHTFYQNQLSQILTCHCEVSDFGFCSFALRT